MSAVDHVVKLAGIDHVALSTDFNHGGGIVGWENEGDTKAVTEALLRHVYSADQIAKIWSGNVLRVWGAAQASGRRL